MVEQLLDSLNSFLTTEERVSLLGWHLDISFNQTQEHIDQNLINASQIRKHKTNRVADILNQKI